MTVYVAPNVSKVSVKNKSHFHKPESCNVECGHRKLRIWRASMQVEKKKKI